MLQTFLSKSLAAKLLWVFVPLVCLAELLVFGVQAWFFYEDEKQELIERLHELSEVQSSALASPMWEFDTEQIENNIAQLEKLQYFKSIVIYDDAKNVMSSLGDFEAHALSENFRFSKKVIHRDGDQLLEVGSVVLTVKGDHIYADLIENTKYNAIILAVFMD